MSATAINHGVLIDPTVAHGQERWAAGPGVGPGCWIACDPPRRSEPGAIRAAAAADQPSASATPTMHIKRRPLDRTTPSSKPLRHKRCAFRGRAGTHGMRWRPRAWGASSTAGVRDETLRRCATGCGNSQPPSNMTSHASTGKRAHPPTPAPRSGGACPPKQVHSHACWLERRASAGEATPGDCGAAFIARQVSRCARTFEVGRGLPLALCCPLPPAGSCSRRRLAPSPCRPCPLPRRSATGVHQNRATWPQPCWTTGSPAGVRAQPWQRPARSFAPGPVSGAPLAPRIPRLTHPEPLRAARSSSLCGSRQCRRS